VNTVKTPRSRAVLDRFAADPELQQLLMGEVPLLSCRQRDEAPMEMRVHMEPRDP
jgi:hypothetical protein